MEPREDEVVVVVEDLAIEAVEEVAVAVDVVVVEVRIPPLIP